MDSFLKEYNITLTALTPIFIGSGRSIGKKEYVTDIRNKIVSIVDKDKMYDYLNRHELIDEYLKYILNENIELYKWFRNNNITSTEYNKFIRYTLDAADCFIKEKSRFEDKYFDKLANKDISEFVRDPYGNPYIPGSSIKGALRTIIAWAEIVDKNSCLDTKEIIQSSLSEPRSIKKTFETIGKSLDSKVFNKLNREGTQSDDMVNSFMSGIKVTDSKALKNKDLILCQKYDLMPKKAEGKNKLNLLRESIKPGTKINTTITLDSGIFPYSIEQLQEMIDKYSDYYQNEFVSHFPNTDTPYEAGAIYIGGGVGFVDKTLIYGLYDRPESVKKASEIIQKTINSKAQKEHKHVEDASLGVSPHMLKCTEYKGRIYEMGKCKIEIN